MSKILEMRENRKKAWEAAKAFVETKRDKDGLLSEKRAPVFLLSKAFRRESGMML